MSFLNLTFLAPIAFLGLVALAVPIYLHMRHKPRAEIYKFPAIDFLLKAQRKKKRRFKAEQLLLMLFRIGVIGLLAFLFAKPFSDRAFGDGVTSSSTPLIVILDDSVSMLGGEQGERFFDEAKERLGDTLRSRGGAPTYLMLASAPTRHLDRGSASALRELMPSLMATTSRTTLDDAYAEAIDLAAREGWAQSTIRIFTDGSLSAWDNLPERKPDKVDVIYSSLRETKKNFRNLGVSEVNQTPGDQNSIEVSLINGSDRDVDVSLSVSGSGMSTIRHQMLVDAKGRSSHFFGLQDNPPPTLSVKLPDDDFDLDNEVLYAPRQNKRTRILVVDGDTNPDPVRNESFFLKNALGFEESEKYGFSFEVVTPVGLTKEKVENHDVIFMLNVDVPDKTLLGGAVAAGKGLFVAMGSRVDFERWNELLTEYDLQIWETKPLGSPQPLEIKDFDHPFFSPIDEFEWRSYLQDVGINQLRLVSVGRANVKVPLSLGDGSPLLISKQAGQGRLMIWTSTMDVDWNNFPLEFGFVPFVRQVTAWLDGRESSTTFRTLTVDDVLANGMIDQLNLKYTSDAFRNLAVSGPKPGIYTRVDGKATEFLQVALDPRELDFNTLESQGEDGSSEDPLEELGFRSYLRADLAPTTQWLLFLLLVVESLVAGRITLNWGSR